MMNGSNRTLLVIAFVVVVLLFLFFGGNAMTGSNFMGGMMRGWNMGQNSGGWAWLPAVVMLAIGVALGWILFARKR